MSDWFPWYPALYEADTLHLTAEQDGVYRRLIDWYMQKRRPPPDNDQALAAIARIGLEDWVRVAPAVREFFKPRDGRLRHSRCDRELDQQDRRQNTRGEVARSGAKARWEKVRSSGDIAATSMPEAAGQHALSNGSALLPASPQHASEHATGQDRTRQVNQSAQQSEPRPKAAQPGRSKPEIEQLQRELFEAAGVSDRAASAPGWLNLSPIIRLLDQGYRLHEDVLPVIRARRHDSVRSWAYFVAAIEEEKTGAAAGARPNGRKGPAVVPGVVPPQGPDWDARLAYYAEHRVWRGEWPEREFLPAAIAARLQALDDEHAASARHPARPATPNEKSAT